MTASGVFAKSDGDVLYAYDVNKLYDQGYLYAGSFSYVGSSTTGIDCGSVYIPTGSLSSPVAGVEMWIRSGSKNSDGYFHIMVSGEAGNSTIKTGSRGAGASLLGHWAKIVLHETEGFGMAQSYHATATMHAMSDSGWGTVSNRDGMTCYPGSDVCIKFKCQHKNDSGSEGIRFCLIKAYKGASSV